MRLMQARNDAWIAKFGLANGAHYHWVLDEGVLVFPSQGHSLMAHLAEQGWVCVSVQYRVAPRHQWPRHIQDVRAAVAWTRTHIHEVGGDPKFIATAGCSAGGHLAALTGLAPHDADFNAELTPDADSSVDAVVSLYGRYDWTDRTTRDSDEFVDFSKESWSVKPWSATARCSKTRRPSPAPTPTRHHFWSFTATPTT